MIFKQYDLAIYFEEVDNIINDPYLYPIELNVNCSEIGSATIIIHAKEISSPRPIKRKRHFRRFLLHGGVNEELIDLMADENVRVLNRYDFFTEQGAIVVIDYQVNK